ncbi:hypothetical protein ASA1KI_42900 [Opitutales bacterium ASA1]|uniref:DUF5615 family PIN-like protein n=1 Tax=Congregicoccus parvus TaxID=3081749 RepID=UPI002B29B8B3|nr:hypothetical protein ASA1KI_42900 [Opitutales bacterium ASA1]
MKFIFDAHLPPGLVNLVREAGHEAVHTSELPEGNRTPDHAIADLAHAPDSVVVTKDTDFYFSHLLTGRPTKLLLVRTGNMRAADLKRLFARNLPEILRALEIHSLVELDRSTVRLRDSE